MNAAVTLVGFLAATVISMATLTLGALGFARWALAKYDPDPDPPEPRFEPYCFPEPLGVPCFLCGVAKQYGFQPGPGHPQACIEGTLCPGHATPHHHVTCSYCGGTWMRRAKGKS